MASNDDQNITEHRERFSDVVDEPRRMLPPIRGFEKMPLVSLEEAIKPLVSLVSNVELHASNAKKNCRTPVPDGLSIDESASIRLYTMEWKPRDKCLYVVLNKSLRAEDREEIKPWFLYLRLVIGSLLKIPSVPRHVFRGVKLDLSPCHIKGEKTVWWAFSSSTDSLQVLESEAFFGKKGDRTLFDIDCYSGKDIRQHSTFPNESEVLLLAATQFQIASCLNPGNGLHIIHLKEIEPEFPLIEKIPGVNIYPKASGNQGKLQQFQSSPLPKTTEPKPTSLPKTADSTQCNLNLERRIAGYQSRSPIDLGKQQLTDRDMRIVVRQAIVDKQCTKLSLQNNEITREGMSTIAEAMRDSTALEQLDFSNNHLTDADLFPLAQELSANETIEVEEWKCCGIAKMKKVTKAPIKALDLSNNNIGDEGVKYLAEVIKSKRTLTSLHLNNNQISDRGVKLLVQALSYPTASLQKLYLHNNRQISDESVNALTSMLKQNQSLNTLWLINCNLTNRGRQTLQEAAAGKRNFYLNIENHQDAKGVSTNYSTFQ